MGIVRCGYNLCEQPSYARGLCRTHYARLWRQENPSAAKKATQKWLAKNTEKVKANHRHYYAANPERARKWRENAKEQREIEREQLKSTVLAYYGKSGKAQCCWDGCLVDDVDVLSLDHILNDGGKHRKQEKVSGGSSMYRRLQNKEQYVWVSEDEQ